MPSVRRSLVPDGQFGADAGSAASPPARHDRRPRSRARAVRPSRVLKASATGTRLPSIGCHRRARALAGHRSRPHAHRGRRLRADAWWRARPGGRDQARADSETPADPAVPSQPTDPSGPPPQCSGDATTPAAPEPAQAVPAATADYYFQGSLESSLGTAPDLVEVDKGSSVFTADGTTGVTVLRFAGGRGLALLRRTTSSGARDTRSRSCSASISSTGTARSSTSRTARPTMACTCWTDA